MICRKCFCISCNIGWVDTQMILLLISGERYIVVSRTQGVCDVIDIFFDLFQRSYNCGNFHHCIHCRMCITDFIGRGMIFFARPLFPSVKIGKNAFLKWFKNTSKREKIKNFSLMLDKFLSPYVKRNKRAK